MGVRTSKTPTCGDAGIDNPLGLQTAKRFSARACPHHPQPDLPPSRRGKGRGLMTSMRMPEMKAAVELQSETAQLARSSRS